VRCTDRCRMPIFPWPCPWAHPDFPSTPYNTPYITPQFWIKLQLSVEMGALRSVLLCVLTECHALRIPAMDAFPMPCTYPSRSDDCTRLVFTVLLPRGFYVPASGSPVSLSFSIGPTSTHLVATNGEAPVSVSIDAQTPSAYLLLPLRAGVNTIDVLLAL
jgi:hypothetical protein